MQIILKIFNIRRVKKVPFGCPAVGHVLRTRVLGSLLELYETAVTQICVVQAAAYL
jgi:hypothetical protein